MSKLDTKIPPSIILGGKKKMGLPTKGSPLGMVPNIFMCASIKRWQSYRLLAFAICIIDNELPFVKRYF